MKTLEVTDPIEDHSKSPGSPKSITRRYKAFASKTGETREYESDEISGITYPCEVSHDFIERAGFKVLLFLKSGDIIFPKEYCALKWKQAEGFLNVWEKVMDLLAQMDIDFTDHTLEVDIAADEPMEWAARWIAIGSDDYIRFKAAWSSKCGSPVNAAQPSSVASVNAPVIMDQNHPGWAEFEKRMSVAVRRGHCAAGQDKRIAHRVLSKMGVDDRSISASCRWFEEHGGFCDCEITLNVFSKFWFTPEQFEKVWPIIEAEMETEEWKESLRTGIPPKSWGW